MPRLTGIVPCIALLFLGATFQSSSAEETSFPKVSAEEVLSNLSPKHPRLMVKAEDFQNIKDTIQKNETYKAWWQKIQANADKILTEPPVAYDIPDGLRLLETCRKVLRRSQVLAFSYQMSGDTKYKDRLWKEMETVMQFQDWNPKHFLDVAEMTTAVSIAYDWIYDAWSPEQRQKLKKAIREKGLQPGLDDYHTPKKFWPKCQHNWNQVCNGGMGIGVLAIAEDIPDIAKEILQTAMDNLPLAMQHYAPDGAWGEGPGYWAYATSYTAYFLSSLETATGNDWGFSKIPGFSLAGDFPLYMNGPSGRSYNFADASEHAVHGSEMYWLSGKFAAPDYALFEQKFSDKSPTPLDMIWGIPALAKAGTPGSNARPLGKHFRETEVAVLRSDAQSPKAFYIGFKCGSNKVNHSHLDCGSFIFDALGKRWGMDPGADDYNLPGYFGKQRWSYYRLRAEGHNTLVFNPDFQPDQDTKADTKIIQFADRPEMSFAIADLTQAYATHASSVKRGIALKNKNSVIIQDEIESSQPNELWWFFHTQAEISLDENKKSALLTFDDQQIVARIIAPSTATFAVMNAAPLPSSPQPEKQMVKQPKRPVQKLAIHFPKVKNTGITVEFALPGSTPGSVVPLADWK